MLEFRFSRGNRVEDVLDALFEENAHLRKPQDPRSEQDRSCEHRVKCCYVSPLGDVDALLIRRCGSLFPYLRPPNVAGVQMRRNLGFYSFDRKWIAAHALGDAAAPFLPLSELYADTPEEAAHFCHPSRQRPFVGVIYAELSAIEYLLASTCPSQRRGPAQQTLGHFVGYATEPVSTGALPQAVRDDWGPEASRLDVAFAQRREQAALPPLRFQARIVPLLGMDRIPLALLVEAQTIDEISLVAALLRSLPAPLPGTSAQALASVGALLEGACTTATLAEHHADSPLLSNTMTVVGLQLERTEEPEEGSLVLSRASSRWRLGHPHADLSDHALYGGLVTYIRQSSARDGTMRAPELGGLGLRRLDPPHDLTYIGRVDSVLAWPTYEEGRFHNQVRSVPLRTIAEPLRELMLSDQELDTVTLPYTLAWPLPSPQGNASALLHEKLRSLQAKQLGDEGWLKRWLSAARGHLLSYSHTTAGSTLINEVLHLAHNDPATFGELAPSVQDWLDLIQPEPPLDTAALMTSFEAMEALLDARRRRSAPIRRSSRDAAAFDALAGIEISRQAYAGYLHGVRDFLGITTPILILDSSLGQMKVTHAHRALSIVTVPLVIFLVPLMWRVGHEVGHIALRELQRSDTPHLPRGEDIFCIADEMVDEWNLALSSRPQTLSDCLRFTESRLLACLPQPTPERFHIWRALAQLFSEVAADLIAAATLLDKSATNNAESLRGFWWSHGPALVHAWIEKKGKEPLTLDETSQLILRVCVVSFLLEQHPSHLEPDQLWEQLYQVTAPPEHSPVLSGAPRKMRERLSDLRVDLGDCAAAWEPARAHIYTSLQDWRTDNIDPALKDRIGNSMQQWLALCSALYQEYADLARQKTWPQREAMTGYLKEVLKDADAHYKGSREWLPLQSEPSSAEGARTPDGTAPWLSRRGAVRAGPADPNVPRRSFFFAYQQHTMALLLGLARSNRIRRYRDLKKLLT